MRAAGRRGRRWRSAALVLGAGLTGLATAGLAGCSSGSPVGAGTNYVSGDGTITLVPAAKRQAPVAVRGTTLEGQPVALSAYRGKVVVLNVWGSWCPPCRAEAPALEAAAQQLASQGVQFLGINTNDPDAAQALAFQKKFGVSYPSLADRSGEVLLSLRGAVAPNAIPTTLVIDQQGRIAARISAATTQSTLTALVSDVLAGRDAR
jgi:thiol-disulfide isomerase/thioredoxin